MITVRTATLADFDDYVRLQAAAWGLDLAATADQAKIRFATFPEGILIAESDGQAVGTTTAILLSEYDFDRPRSWSDTTDEGSCRTHTPGGRFMFGVDLSSSGLPRAVPYLLAGCTKLARQLGVEACVYGARLPGYAAYHHEHPEVSAFDYLFSWSPDGRFRDQQIRMYTAALPGVEVLGPIPDYFPPDEDSEGFGVLMRWRNPYSPRPVDH